jgi:steroid 5-alpha reductase family enzyme
MTQLTKDRFTLLLIYIASFAAGTFVGNSYYDFGLLGRSAMIILSAVLVIWLFSFISDNSSVFDPYWSVAPPFFILYFWYSTYGFCFHAESWYTFARFILIFILVTWWGSRLTYNFFRGWKGMKHEDWRYVNFRKKTGVMYWVVSLLGIQLFPAFMVYMGCLSIWSAIVNGIHPMNFLDIMGVLVTGMAIWLETRADKELFQYVRTSAGEGKTMNKGLWSISRHPNYLGEITFWWGLWFFAIASNPSYWWVIIGPAAMTLMFVFVSIPMIEKRLMERKSDYSEYRNKIPMLLPNPFRKS